VAIVDEVAFLRTDDISANPDAEVVNSLRPGLSSIPGSMLLLASSPYAKRGVLYESFKRHWGRDDSRTLVWRGTSIEMNPLMDRDLIQQAREDDPARASAEYDAQFRDDVATFVSREVIDACTVPLRYELPRITGIRYHAYVDPSGGSSDSYCLAIAHMERGLVVLDCVRETRPPFSPEAVTEDYADIAKSYGCHVVRGDRYAGEFPRELFRKRGINYELSEQTASEMYQAVLARLNSKQVELLDLPRIAKQFGDLERRTSRGGRDQISHPPGGHDDLVNSITGALLMAGAVRQPMRIDPALLEKLRYPTPGSPNWSRMTRGY
jgi:hypothetical protein